MPDPADRDYLINIWKMNHIITCSLQPLKVLEKATDFPLEEKGNYHMKQNKIITFIRDP